ncbi:MAG TPA: copper resistance protein NlpE N-terminal domain-containing protein [Fulvivirga sp.]|nr:copper resistance protein NlpE N-terminal domain-containing protein [Fulvivirga sp.]
MSIKLIACSAILAIAFTSCHQTKKVSTIDAVPTADSHTAQNSLDWQGTYYGVLPCASCEGIETELTIADNANYVLIQQYLGEENSTFTTKGSFHWEGNVIKLASSNEGDSPKIFKVEEGKIRQLDLEGNPVTGKMANLYVLTKNGNSEVEDRKWKLIELDGKPVEGSADTHFIIFHSKNNRIEARADCNALNFNYSIRNKYVLTVSGGISTQMACPGQQLEQKFIKAIEEADNISVNNTSLSINKGRMAPLARFELVK